MHNRYTNASIFLCSSRSYGGIDISDREIGFLNRRKSNKYLLLLISFLVAAYLLDNMVFGPVITGIIGSYLLPAMMWGLLIIFICWLPRVRPAGSLRLRRLFRWLALVSAGIGVIGILLQGFMGGFGKSPYDHTLLGMLINIVSLGACLIAVEMSRSWFINRYFARRAFIGIPLIAFIYMIFNFPFNRITNLNGGQAITEFIGTEFFPEFAQNLLATFLAFLGGPVPAIIYRGIMLAIERLSPILPNSNWITATLIGTLAPVLGMILVHQIYQEESGEVSQSRQGSSSLSWLFTSVASVLIIWFCVGVFSYAPRVILSGSMQPGINIGDVVIIHKIPGEEAQLGDVIMFPSGDVKITHRIINVQGSEDSRMFQTKGDFNGAPDSNLVSEQEVLGKVVMTIPKAGWLTLMLRGS